MNYSKYVLSNYFIPPNLLKFVKLERLQKLQDVANEFWDPVEARNHGCSIFCDQELIMAKNENNEQIDFFVIEKENNKFPSWFRQEIKFQLKYCYPRLDELEYATFQSVTVGKEIGIYKIKKEVFKGSIESMFYEIFRNELHMTRSYRNSTTICSNAPTLDDYSRFALSKFLIAPNKIEIVDLRTIDKIAIQIWDFELAKKSRSDCSIYCVGECLLEYQLKARASMAYPEKWQQFRKHEKLSFVIIDKEGNNSFHQFLNLESTKKQFGKIRAPRRDRDQLYIKGNDELNINGRSIVLYVLKDLEEMEYMFLPRARFIYYDCQSKQLHFGDWYRSEDRFDSWVSDEDDLKLKLQMKNLNLDY